MIRYAAVCAAVFVVQPVKAASIDITSSTGFLGFGDVIVGTTNTITITATFTPDPGFVLSNWNIEDALDPFGPFFFGGRTTCTGNSCSTPLSFHPFSLGVSCCFGLFFLATETNILTGIADPNPMGALINLKGTGITAPVPAPIVGAGLPGLLLALGGLVGWVRRRYGVFSSVVSAVT